MFSVGRTRIVIVPICLCKMIVLTFLSWPLQAAGVTKSVTLVLLVTRIWRAVRPQINVILTDTNCIVIIMTPVTERARLMSVNIYLYLVFIINLKVIKLVQLKYYWNTKLQFLWLEKFMRSQTSGYFVLYSPSRYRDSVEILKTLLWLGSPQYNEQITWDLGLWARWP